MPHLLDKLNLHQKLVLLSGTAIVALLAAVLTGLYGIHSGIQGVRELGQGSVPALLALQSLEKAQIAQKASSFEAAIWEKDYDAQAVFAKIGAEKHQAELEAEAARRDYEGRLREREDAARWAQFLQEWEIWEKLDHQVTSLIDALAATREAAAQKEIFRRYYALGSELQTHYQASRALLTEIVALNMAAVEDTSARADRNTSLSRGLMIGVGVLATASLVLLALVITVSILRQMGGDPAEAVVVAQRIAAGDLVGAVPVRHGDPGSLLASLAHMQQQLHESVQRLMESERRFHSVFANLYEAVALQRLVFDAAGTPVDYRIDDVNGQFLRLVERPREQVVERLATDVYRCAEPPYLALYREVVETGKATSLEVYFQPLDRYFEISVAPWEEDGFATIFSDITDRKQTEERLHRIAHYDALTQLPNRVLLADRMKQAMALARRSKQMLAVCYLDLDGFKPINDTHGHEVGDRLLIEIAKRLRLCLRASDTAARLGGDEFVLLLGGISQVSECRQAIERILALLCAPCDLQDLRVMVTASVGITLYPLDDSDSDALIRHADQAMYLAKQSGRSRYCIFDAERDRQVLARHVALASIREALEARQFCLYYQPKVNQRLGTVIGVEALIRWQHPERGLVPPLEFLPVIDGSELEIALGEWVIDDALRQASAWHEEGLHLPVSVNVSSHQLEDPRFSARLEAILASYPHLPAGSLEVEILESAALDDVSLIASIITHFTALGVSFALDDFGTGYSSLAYLKRVPAQTVKIDRSFVRDMLNDREDLAIVEGVIGLAQAFQRKVVAEGVESEAHGRRLAELHCDLVQGYGIARPMPAAALRAWMARYEAGERWQVS